MAPEDIVHRLPASHLLALCLRGADADDGVIAAELGIEAEAVEPLLRVARAKLASAVGLPTYAGGP